MKMNELDGMGYILCLYTHRNNKCLTEYFRH